MNRIGAVVLLLAACAPPGDGRPTVDSAAPGQNGRTAIGRAPTGSLLDSVTTSGKRGARVRSDSMLRDSAFEPAFEVDEKTGTVKPTRRPRR